jgi:transcriptional regulator with XRE-family HTH domain
MVERGNDPALFRRRLRSDLRKMRETLGMDQREIALAMDWSPSKLIRIEAGAVAIATNDLRALLAHYGVTDRLQIESLVETAKKSRERSPWWNEFKDFTSPEFLAMCGYEASAKVIRSFEPFLIPGLLQTEEYARDLFQYVRGSKDPKRIDGLVRLRLQRQDLLSADGAQSLHFILDEAVIRRVVGGPVIMRRQLLQLKELAKRPNIVIRIVPFGQGMYRGLRVPYVLFEFDDPRDETILYLENPSGGVVLQEHGLDPEEGVPAPTVYLEMFWELEQVARIEDTEALIDRALADFATVDLRRSADHAAAPAASASKKSS